MENESKIKLVIVGEPTSKSIAEAEAIAKAMQNPELIALVNSVVYTEQEVADLLIQHTKYIMDVGNMMKVNSRGWFNERKKSK